MSGMLEGKRGLVVGVGNRRSLAWSCAKALRREGMRLALNYANERLERSVRPLAEELEVEALLPCDVTKPEEMDALVEGVERELGGLDCLVHAVAFAKREELRGDFFETSLEGFRIAQEVSVYSLAALARRTAGMLEASGGSIVTLTYIGSERVVPHYNVMGVAKAALEASVRYLANDLGPRGVRVNAISAGPVRTVSATGIEGFGEILEHIAERSPLRRNVDPDEVGDACAFLASPLARGITGSILYVDAGFHAMGI